MTKVGIEHCVTKTPPARPTTSKEDLTGTVSGQRPPPMLQVLFCFVVFIFPTLMYEIQSSSFSLKKALRYTFITLEKTNRRHVQHIDYKIIRVGFACP